MNLRPAEQITLVPQTELQGEIRLHLRSLCACVGLLLWLRANAEIDVGMYASLLHPLTNCSIDNNNDNDDNNNNNNNNNL